MKKRTRKEIIETIKASIIKKQEAIAESQLRINKEILGLA